MGVKRVNILTAYSKAIEQIEITTSEDTEERYIETEVTVCPKCNGSGIQQGTKRIACMNCLGSGTDD